MRNEWIESVKAVVTRLKDQLGYTTENKDLILLQQIIQIQLPFAFAADLDRVAPQSPADGNSNCTKC
jgi:hypothetical protein